MVARQAVLEAARVGEGCVERYVSGTDEKGNGGQEDQAQGYGSAVVEQLKANNAIQHEYPQCRDYCAEVDSGEALCKISIAVCESDSSLTSTTLFCKSLPPRGRPPTVKISHSEMMM